MKFKFITALICCLATAAFSQVAKTDSVKKTKSKSFSIKISHKDTVSVDTIKPVSRFSVQLTLSRIDLGLSTLTDNGSFTLSPANQVLESSIWKSNNFGFEFFQMGYRFNHYFKVYLGTGIDWTHFRLKKDVTIQPDQPKFIANTETISFDKNRFSSTYLRVPLSLQFRTKDDVKGKKIYFVVGPEIGLLINGKVKQISNEKGKQKVKDDFNLNPVRYGASARFGYGDFGIYTKYYANDFFADNQGPKNLKNIAFGVMLGF
jgi:opacity protein-like surface antigen